MQLNTSPKMPLLDFSGHLKSWTFQFIFHVPECLTYDAFTGFLQAVSRQGIHHTKQVWIWLQFTCSRNAWHHKCSFTKVFFFLLGHWAFMSVEEKIIANEYLQGEWVTFQYLLKFMDSFRKFSHFQNASRDKKVRVYKFTFRCKNTWQQSLHCNSVKRIYYKHTFSGMIPDFWLFFATMVQNADANWIQKVWNKDHC